MNTNVEAGLPQFFVFYNFVRGEDREKFLLPENKIFTNYKIAISC